MTLRYPRLSVLALMAGLGLWSLSAYAQTSVTDPFTFVSWGDSRDSNTGPVNTPVLSALSNQVDSLLPVFTIFAGDLCDSLDATCVGDTTNGWLYAVNGGDPSNNLFDITFPFRGNHDGDTALWDQVFSGHAAAAVGRISASNVNVYSLDGAERTYSFDYGNSHIVGIDMPDGDISTMTDGQITWLDEDLTAAEDPSRGIIHTFIMDHGPIYYVDGHRSAPSSQLIAVMNAHPSISATFHGHEHVMAHIHIDSAHLPGVTHPWEEFVTGAAGAPLYRCNQKRLIGPTDYCEAESPGFMSIKVDGQDVTVKLYLQGEATEAQTWSFTKSANPLVTLSTTNLDFGTIRVGRESKAQTVTLTNTGGGPLNLVSPGIAITGANSGDFSEANDCQFPIALYASCTFAVTFAPTAAGQETATLSISDDAGGSPQKVTLSGTGQPAHKQ